MLDARALEDLDRSREVAGGGAWQRGAEVLRRPGALRLALSRRPLQTPQRDLDEFLYRGGVVVSERGDAQAATDADRLGAVRDACAVEPLSQALREGYAPFRGGARQEHREQRLVRAPYRVLGTQHAL